jgi:glycerate kinase
MIRALLAPQELKGSLTASQAARALADGLREPGWSLDLLPLADGGPGTLELVHGQRPEARVHHALVRDPLGAQVDARWLQLDADTALVEMAEAAGLWRVGAVRRPLDVDTQGVGALIIAALDAGCTRVIVGAGGSATSDAGAGALFALGARFYDEAGRELPPTPRALAQCAHVDRSRLRQVPRLTVWTDVRSPLADAATVFSPQKGAGPTEVAHLTQTHQRLARLVDAAVATRPGTGAAGGLAFGLHAFLGATIEPGFAALDAVLGLEARVARAQLVVTAEGRLDHQTTADKGPWALAALARKHGARCVAFVGACTLPEATWRTRFDDVIELGPKGHPDPAARLRDAARRWAQHTGTSPLPATSE